MHQSIGLLHVRCQRIEHIRSEKRDVTKLKRYRYTTITRPTRITPNSSTIIDHIITNSSSHHISPGIIESDLTDHYPVFCIIQNTINSKRHNKYYYRVTKNFDSEQFLIDLASKLHNHDLPDLNISNVNNVFDEILKTISSTINTHAPLKLASRKKQKILSKPWLAKGIIKSIRRNRFIHNLKSFYLLGSDQQKLFYKRYANKLTKVKQLSKKLYFENKFNNSDNPRKMWNTLRNLLPYKMSCTVTKVLKINNFDVNHPADIANHFNNYFCGIGKSLAYQINDTCSKDSSHFLRIRIPESIFIAPKYPQEIKQIISSLRNSSSSGPEGFSFFIKSASADLASPLSFIFNFCIENGIFPESLKISKVIPIYKSGAKSEVNNYRPISLLPVLSKAGLTRARFLRTISCGNIAAIFLVV